MQPSNKIKAVLDGFPWPPQSNNIYATDRRTGRRFPSKEYKQFQKDALEWADSKRDVFEVIAPALREAVADPMRFIYVSLFLITGPTYIWTQDKTRKKKKWDGSNRIKVVHDAITNALGIDDCQFQCGPTLKVVSPELTDERYCIIELTVRKIETLDEVVATRGWVNAENELDDIDGEKVGHA